MRPIDAELRAYILAMTSELAEMADKIHDRELSNDLRLAARHARGAEHALESPVNA